MKTYTVYFNESVCYHSTVERYNPETKSWEESESAHWDTVFTFFSLANAKKFIKQNIHAYKSSPITKTWSNGDWENLGEIQLSGSNKTFVANTKQKQANY